MVVGTSHFLIFFNELSRFREVVWFRRLSAAKSLIFMFGSRFRDPTSPIPLNGGSMGEGEGRPSPYPGEGRVGGIERNENVKSQKQQRNFVKKKDAISTAKCVDFSG